MRVFLTFLAAYVLSQFYRSFLAVIAPELAGELALDPRALGDMQAFWIWGFIALQIPVGWALDTLGPRRTVTALMVFAVAGAVLFARATSAFDLNLAMALIGAGCSAIYMGALYIFGRVNRPERFALLCSWLLGLGTAGNLLAATPLAVAAGTIGWRNTMLVMAAATALSALSVYLLIRDPPPAEGGDRQGFVDGLIGILSIRALWPLLPITAIGYSVVLAERGLWAGPYFSAVHGLSPVDRGNALLLMAAAMSLGAMAYGPLDRTIGTRKWVVMAGSLMTAICFFALGALDLTVLSAVLVMAMLGLFGMTYGVLMAHGRSFFPDHLLGRGITFMNMLFFAGAGILQPVSGRFMTGMKGEPPAEAFATLHVAFGFLLLIAAAAYLASREQGR